MLSAQAVKKNKRIANLRLLRCHRCNQQTMHEQLSPEEMDAHTPTVSVRIREVLASMMHKAHTSFPELREYRCTICRCRGG